MFASNEHFSFQTRSAWLVMVLFWAVGTPVLSGQKRVQTIRHSRIIPSSAETVWQALVNDFGAVSKTHPKVRSSTYINGPHKAVLGAERLCYLDKDKTRYKHEKIVAINPAKYMIKVQLLKAHLIPLNAKYCHMVYSIKPLHANSSELTITLQYRTRPGLLGGVFKNRFRKTIADHSIGIQYGVLTGKAVTRAAFKKIRKRYGS